MGDLSQRLLTAAVVLPVLVVILLRGGVPLLLLVCGVTLLGGREYYQLASAQSMHPPARHERAFGLFACLLFPVAAYVFAERALPALVTAVIAGGMVLRLFTDHPVRRPIPAVSSLVQGPLYVGFLLSHAVLLRERVDQGTFLIFLAVACTMLSDTGAYLGGKTLGRRPLARSVSPKKTVEGGIAGLATGPVAALAAWAAYGAWDAGGGHPPLGHVLILGALIAIASLFGDLAESLFKRGAGVKDSGEMFPGHGGVLDRLDSLLFSIPLTYYYSIFLL